MALNAYRQLGMNNNAVSKSLEKLSSGFRINRAGDDAAGLAISEKMKAQITGLETASANAQDGISLIQTAEGNLTEVHSMLNRMVELATKSANGTYTQTERDALQSEVDSLLEEIDRISKSANFNGTNLLDGSLDADNIAASASAVSNITTTPYSSKGASDAFKATYVTNRPAAATQMKYAEFVVRLDDVKITKNTDGTAANTHEFTLKVGDAEIKIDSSATAKLSGNADATAENIVDALIQNGKNATDADGTVSTAQGTIAKLGNGTGAYVEIDGNIYKMERFSSGTMVGVKFTQQNKPADGTYINPDYEVSYTGKADGTQGKGGKVSGTVNDHVQMTKTGNGMGASHQAQVDVAIDFSKIKDGDKLNVGDTTYVFKIGKDSSTAATGSEKLIDLHSILEDSEDLADEDKLKQAMTTIVEAIDGGTNTNTTWTAGNVGVSGTVGTISFQSKSDYTDGTTGIAGKTGTDDPKCDMKTEASVMKQFYGESKQVDASVSFEVDPTKIKKGQVLEINGLKFEFTDSNKPTDPEAAAIDLSTLGDIDKGNLLASQTADVMAAIKSTVSSELGTTGFAVDVDGNKLTITSKDLGNTTVLKENRIAAEVKIPGSENGGLILQIGDTADSFNQMAVSIADMSAKGLGLDGLDISTLESAQGAIDTIRTAINTVSTARANMGALQNRLEHTINNLDVSVENLSAANSRIRDTDMAKEMMNYTKMNVLVQSAQAMLAQANQQPQSVLQLLQ